MDRSTALKLVFAGLLAGGVFLGLFVLGASLVSSLLEPAPSGEPASEFRDVPLEEAEAPASPGRAFEEDPAVDVREAVASRRIASLIERLGSPRYAERRGAEDDLVALGRRAVPFLEQALSHEDAEVRWRAREALRRIREGGG